MNAKETLDLISKPWCNLNDIMLLAQVGRNSALKIKKEIKCNFYKDNKLISTRLLPMNAVVEYLNLDIKYLESRK